MTFYHKEKNRAEKNVVQSQIKLEKILQAQQRHENDLREVKYNCNIESKDDAGKIDTRGKATRKKLIWKNDEQNKTFARPGKPSEIK